MIRFLKPRGYNNPTCVPMLYNQWLHMAFLHGICTYDFYAEHSWDTHDVSWKGDVAFFIFGLVAAFLDGVAIAQAWDWLTSGHRLSIWVLM